MEKIRLVHIDGKFPNLALMALSSFFKKQKKTQVHFSRFPFRDLWETEYDLVLGSQIFQASSSKVEILKSEFPNAIIGGVGSENPKLTVKDFTGTEEHTLDYSLYPEFLPSIGFSSRGCRRKCPFCVVPQIEGEIRENLSIEEIWRGTSHPKKLLLLDNDFFGQPFWEEKSLFIIAGDFHVSLCQGINVRTLTEEQAFLIRKMQVRDDNFTCRRIYTSWDSVADEKQFFKGISKLLLAGESPQSIMVFFLTNFWEAGLTEDVWYRFYRLKEVGLRQFPMIYETKEKHANLELKQFQSWVIRRLYFKEDFNHYRNRREKRYELNASVS